MTFVHWIHHLFNPHCPECADEERELSICQSCETLKMQLSIANHEKQEMLNTILSLTKPAVEQTAPAVNYQEVKPKLTTWSVRKHMLEAEDRKAAQLLRERSKKPINEQIADLEKEVGLDGDEEKSNA